MIVKELKMLGAYDIIGNSDGILVAGGFGQEVLKEN